MGSVQTRTATASRIRPKASEFVGRKGYSRTMAITPSARKVMKTVQRNVDDAYGELYGFYTQQEPGDPMTLLSEDEEKDVCGAIDALTAAQERLEKLLKK